MKCIQCGKDCTYKERADGRCPHCKARFALEPRRSDKLSDGAIQAAVDAVSSQGKVRWNLEHLYYEIRRRKGTIGLNVPACGGCLAFAVIATAINPWGGGDVMLLVGSALGLSFGTRWVNKRTAALKTFPRDTFNREWSRWAEVHGTPPSMIVPTGRVAGPPPAMESDLADYSFDRAVICDRADTVDLLVANNFHFENNCAVLSADGYPPQAFDAVRQMLKRNPRLKVWVLHDATPDGCKLARRLNTDPDWFDKGVTIVDVGLRPGNTKPLHPLCDPAAREPGDLDHPAISAEEREWLSKRKLALAAIRPEQVIKRLFRSLSRDESDWIASPDGAYVDDSSFSSDASTSDGGGDSFG